MESADVGKNINSNNLPQFVIEQLKKRGGGSDKSVSKYKIISRQLDEKDEPCLVIHTLGEKGVWAISIREAANNKNVLAGLSEKESDLVRWLYKHDSEIDNYNYVG